MDNKIGSKTVSKSLSRREELEVLVENTHEGQTLRLKEILQLGIRSASVAAMVRRSHLEKAGHGYYKLNPRLHAGRESSEDENSEVSKFPNPEMVEEFQEVLIRSPRSIICLKSAARYHDLTEMTPSEIWVGVKHGSYQARTPEWTSVKFVSWRDPKMLDVGVEHHSHKGMDFRITDLERTVVDFYKYSPHLDRAMPRKVLSEALMKPEFSREKLQEYSQKIGVRSAVQRDVEMLDLLGFRSGNVGATPAMYGF